MAVQVTPILLLTLLGCAISAYLLGSINFAIPVCRLLYKADVRAMGSGNPGMTNVARNFGKKGATITLAGDMLKGIVAVLISWWLMALFVPGADPLYGKYIAAVFAILGHMFPLYYGFKGGKGVATSGGVILALQPVLALTLIAFFLLVFFASKMVSLGSVIGMSLYPVVTLLWCLFVSHKAPVFSTVCAGIIGGLVVWMHRENIKRIAKGTEYKFGQKKKEAAAAAAQNDGESTESKTEGQNA